MEDRKKIIVIVALLVIFGAILAIFVIRDDKKKVIERKTDFAVPDYCTIEDYRAYGSIFRRTGFEAKMRIDSVDHMNEVIQKAFQLYGDDHHEITLQDFENQKYALFSGQKLIPNPSTISWVIVSKRAKSSVVMFVCIEGENTPYAYMYYAE